MEVKLDKRYPVAASLEQAWVVLSDIRATAACMPGAQITEALDDRQFKGTVRSKVGPAVMVFNGDIELQALEASEYRLQMLGKGADKAGSSASMQLTARLEPEGEGCVLAGQAVIVVSGKLAQFGSRLLVPVSDALLAQFADNFRAAAQAVPAPGLAPPAYDDGDSTEVRMVQGAEAPGPLPADRGPAQAPAAPASARAPAAVAPTAPRAAVAPAPVKELNALSLLWAVIKGWFARRFGRAR